MEQSIPKSVQLSKRITEPNIVVVELSGVGLLADMDWTHNESRVWYACIETIDWSNRVRATPASLSRRLNIHRQNIYPILKSLVKKELLEKIVPIGRHPFYLLNPDYGFVGNRAKGWARYERYKGMHGATSPDLFLLDETLQEDLY